MRDQIEPAFGKYNLIFPLQAYCDGATYSAKGSQKLPVGTGSAREVEVSYAPGDIWNLLAGPDDWFVAFDFHRGESGPKPSQPSRAGAPTRSGASLIATDRRGTADGQPLRIWFTDLTIKLAGSDKWVNAQ